MPDNSENFGVTRKVLLPKYSFFNLYFTTIGSGDPVVWFANFSGIVYKNTEKDFWKWESVSFVNVSKQGNTPICMDYVMSANVASPIIESDKKRAQSAVNFSVIAKIQCIGGWEVKNYAGSLPAMYLYAQ